MTTREITIWRVDVTLLTALVVSFLIEIMLSLRAIKTHFKGHLITESYTRGHIEYLKRVVISYEIHKTSLRRVP